MKNKHVKVFLIVYFIILITGTIFYYTIPIGGFVKVEAVEEQNNPVLNEEQILDYISGQSAYKPEGTYKIEKYEFNFQGKELEISESNPNEAILWIERLQMIIK